MSEHRWLSGFGTETFGLEFPRYESVELARAYPDFYHESPHNIFLDALLSQGVTGLAVLIGFLVAAWPSLRSNRFLAAALAAGLVSGMFVCFTLPVEIYFFVTLALLAGQRRTWEVPVWKPAGVVLAILFLVFVARVAIADGSLQQASHSLQAHHTAEALASYARSRKWHPGGSSDDLYFSRAVSSAAPLEALVLAQGATQSSDERQNAWYNLAGFYAAQNDQAGVERSLRRAIEAAPNWFKPHWVLAQMLLWNGRRSEAIAEASRAAELDGGKDAEVTTFLQTLHHSPASQSHN